MAIEFLCPRCQNQLSVSDADAGAKQRCPHCQAKVRVPVPEKTAAPPAPGPVNGPIIEFICPRCQNAMQARADEAGSKQRCPKCQAKVKVPEPEPVAAAASRATIEFKCPRCDELIRARGEHAGIKQFCPRCGGKVRVPTPSFENSAPAADGSGNPATEAAAQTPAAASLAALAESHEDIPWTRPRRRRRRSILGLLVPIWSIALIGGIVYWLMQKPPVKLEGSLSGERLTDTELGPFRVSNQYLGNADTKTRAVLSHLEEVPIRASSQFLTLEFKGTAGGISLFLRTADGADFYRVDPTAAKLLAKYLDENKSEFRSAVEDELTRSVPEFLEAVAKRSEEKKEFPRLAEFRDTVGLASLTTGFGYHVQAAIGKQAYPCVLEDRDGWLFFVLPSGTQEFEIVGRPRGGKTPKDKPQFTGRFTVQVSKKPVSIKREAADPKEKIRKALNK